MLTSDDVRFNNNADGILSPFYRSLDVEYMEEDIQRETWVDPKVQKILVGADLEEGQSTFSLTEVDENGKPIEDGFSITQTNDKYGIVDFDAKGEYINPSDNQRYLFYFAETDTHWYAIREVTSAPLPNIIYDTSTVYFKVDVFKNPDGTLDYSDGYYDGINGSQILDGSGNEAMPVFTNKIEGVDLRVQKRSGDESRDPLEGATYGLWMVDSLDHDAYLGFETSDKNGWITFRDVPLEVGKKYYFKEESAPEGHLVDVYRSQLFTVVPDPADPSKLKLVYESNPEFKASCTS